MDIAEGERLILRIGINLGDVVVDDDDLLGDGVNIAARLQQLADPGGILISSTAYDHLHGKLDVPLDYAGEQKVKNIGRPVGTYRVLLGNPPNFSDRPLQRRWPARRITHGITLALAFIAAAIAWGVFAGSIETQNTPSSIPTVAVLPFKESGDPRSSSYYGSGVAEDIITMLSRVPDLRVLARSSSVAQEPGTKDVRELGRHLGASHLLEGTVRRDADRVRIIAQLVDTTTGEQVWADRFDRTGSDPWAIQDEVTRRIVADLVGDAGTLKLAQYRKAWGADSAELQEYHYYLRAHDLLRRLKPDTNEQARAILREGLSRYYIGARPPSAGLRSQG